MRDKKVLQSSAPTAPPPLEDMAARKDTHEAARRKDFPRWKAAIVASEGNVMRAGVAEFPDLPRSAARDAANRQIKRLGLVEFARKLRLAATGNDGPGRPGKKKGTVLPNVGGASEFGPGDSDTLF